MKTLILFDYDGVLVDSEIVFHNIFINELKKRGVVITSEELMKNFSGNSMIPFNKKIYDLYKINLPKSFYSKTTKIVLDSYKEVKLQGNTIKLLEDLKSRGIFYCIVSGGRREWVLKTMEYVGLSKYFLDRNIFTRECVKNGKPAPDIFLNALKIMNKNPKNCLIIEDSMNGLKAGINSGIDTIAYLGGSHISDSYIKDVKKMNIKMINDLQQITVFL